MNFYEHCDLTEKVYLMFIYIEKLLLLGTSLQSEQEKKELCSNQYHLNICFHSYWQIQFLWRISHKGGLTAL